MFASLCVGSSCTQCCGASSVPVVGGAAGWSVGCAVRRVAAGWLVGCAARRAVVGRAASSRSEDCAGGATSCIWGCCVGWRAGWRAGCCAGCCVG